MRTQAYAADCDLSPSFLVAGLTQPAATDISARESRGPVVLRWDESSLMQLERILVALCESQQAEITHRFEDASGADELGPDGIERMEQLCELTQDESELGEVRRALLKVRAQPCNAIASFALHAESRTSWAIADPLHAAEVGSNEKRARPAGEKISTPRL